MSDTVGGVFHSLVHDHTAGSVVRIERLSSGELLFEASHGTRRSNGTAMKSGDRYHLASISKMLTAVLVLQMAETGRFGPQGIDCLLANTNVLPESVIERLLLVDGQPYGHKLTLRHLLQHTGGLRDAMVDDRHNLGGPAPKSLIGALLSREVLPSHRWTPWSPHRAEVREAGVLNWYLHEVASAGLSPPGESFHYSDTGYVLLGLVIESILGQSLQRSLYEQVLAPLGLSETYLAYVGDPIGLPPDRAPESEPWMGEIPCLTSGVNLSFDWAGGGIVSTAAEQSQLLRALLQGKLFCSSETLRTMTTFILPEGLRAPRLGVGIGLFSTRQRAHEFIGHSGAWGCKLFAAPNKDLLIAGTLNRTDAPEDWHAQLIAALH